MLIKFTCYLVSNVLGRWWWMVSKQRFGRMRLTRNKTDRDRQNLLDRAVQTCNPAHFSRGGAAASETSDMCAQTVAYEVEIHQSGISLPHEEIYQFRYVLSHRTCVIRSSYVVRSSGEHSPVDTDDVVIASSQISWKENTTCLPSREYGYRAY